MTTLLLIRHGQTEWNLEGKYTGQADIPLNETGRLQALQVALEVKQWSIDAIFSSDLMRALETATIVASKCHCGTNVQTDPRLREINQGVWEGMHFDDIKSRFATEFAARQTDPLTVSAPDGETVGVVRKRVMEALRDICQQYPNGRVVVVAHGLALAIVRCCLLKQPIQDVWLFIPPNAEIIEMVDKR